MATWTQLHAYAAILPHITKRQTEVMEALMNANGSTGMELARFMKWEVRNVSPRLNELRTKYGAVHKGLIRQCRITNRPVDTWWCGPATDDMLHLPPPKDDKILHRMHLLVREAPHLNQNGSVPIISQILGVSVKKLEKDIAKAKRKRDKG